MKPLVAAVGLDASVDIVHVALNHFVPEWSDIIPGQTCSDIIENVFSIIHNARAVNLGKGVDEVCEARGVNVLHLKVPRCWPKLRPVGDIARNALANHAIRLGALRSYYLEVGWNDENAISAHIYSHPMHILEIAGKS